MSQKDTANTTRAILGTGSAINVNHTGISKKPTETRALGRLDKITSEDIEKNSRRPESPMNNPNFRG